MGTGRLGPGVHWEEVGGFGSAAGEQSPVSQGAGLTFLPGPRSSSLGDT